jgi:hypothetical protein
VLGEGLGVRRGHTNDCLATSIDNIKANDHCTLHVLGDLDPIEVLFDFCIDLFKYVRVYSNLCSVNRRSKYKLGYKTFFVK